MLKESALGRLIEPEKALQGFLGLSIIFSGKHISFYIQLKITVDRVSIYCLKGVTLQSKFLAWSLHCGSLGLIIKNPHVKFPLNSFLRNGGTTYSMKPLWECALCRRCENGWSCEQLRAPGDSVLLSKDRGRLFVHLSLQTPQKCIVESSLSCTILTKLLSAQLSLKSKAMACSGI